MGMKDKYEKERRGQMDACTNNTNPETDDCFSEYFPAAVKCIAMMAVGYFSGRFHLVSPSDAVGINKFASFWAFPSLLYLTVATSDLSDVRWHLLGAIIIGKLIIYITIVAFCVLWKFRRSLAVGGMFAMLCTVSNDAGLGNVLVHAVFIKVYPGLSTHLFYIQPISMLILHPITLIIMKIDSVENINKVTLIEIVKPIWMTVKNPTILAFVAGLITTGFKIHPLPDYFVLALNVLISAFPANILFLLGISMVGRFQLFQGSKCIVPIVCFFIKMIVTPIILRAIILNFPYHGKEDGDFMFLYGVMAPSSSATDFAKHFELPTDPITTTLTISILAFLPFSYATGSTSIYNLQNYKETFQIIYFYISITSFLCGVLNWIIFIRKRKKSESITMWLVTSQMVLSLGLILLFAIHKNVLFRNVQIVAFSGQVTCHIWTANLTIFLYLKWHFKDVKQGYMLLAGFGIPFSLVVSVLIYTFYIQPEGSSFTLMYNRFFIMTNFIVIFCSLLIIIVFLSLHLRLINTYPTESHSSNTEVFTVSTNERAAVSDPNHSRYENEFAQKETENSSHQNSNSEKIFSVPHEYSESTQNLFEVLIILYIIMVLMLFAQIFKLTSNTKNGVFVIVEFLASLGNFGQGILTFLWLNVNISGTLAIVKQKLTLQFIKLRTCLNIKNRKSFCTR